MRRTLSPAVLITLVLLCTFSLTTANNPPFRQWLPAIFAPTAEPQYLVNVPYFPNTNLDDRFAEMAIFWFGQLSRSTNYTDVRIAFNNSELYLYLASFDRQLWYDTTPSSADLTAWDAATLLIDTGTDQSLSASSYRFVAQFRGDPSPNAAYQLSQRGNGGAWSAANIAFTSIPGWRGDRLNDNNDTEDRGWAMTLRIPFSSLGLSQRPPDGTRWRIAMILHDRDDASGTPIANQQWPPTLNPDAPATWATLNFGLPVYTPPAVSATQEFRIRHGLNGITVADAGVGGQDTNMCNADGNFWDRWGNWSQPPDKADVSVQNQSDIADWPCFAKYYLTFPLTSLPAGRVVVSAKLILSQMGNAEPTEAQPSLIQAMIVGEDWDPNALTWNNAPLARENIGSGWVGVMTSLPDWNNLPKREIDVTRGVARAYAAGQPLRLALYSADSAYHSGKYFVSSRTGDWNAQNRPLLIVTLGQP
ncbi:DNRLRE domain-containing protein [Chloroflexus sp.]|uniref:DNRLRE domain-containing protein n=1 Tax=Chloroflexus sp. TaxID=1904827 RepID=UPI002628EF48|nr:DNRLRE domain-containing protein [uncultured Chloroflexus sp.]